MRSRNYCSVNVDAYWMQTRSWLSRGSGTVADFVWVHNGVPNAFSTTFLIRVGVIKIHGYPCLYTILPSIMDFPTVGPWWTGLSLELWSRVQWNESGRSLTGHFESAQLWPPNLVWSNRCDDRENIAIAVLKQIENWGRVLCTVCRSFMQLLSGWCKDKMPCPAINDT